MKTIFALGFMMFTSTAIFAQQSGDSVINKTTDPHWIVSKPVQLLQIDKSRFKPARLYTGKAWILTKDVHQLQLVRNSPQLSSYRITSGFQPANISKGVARMQFEKNNKK